MLRLPGAPPPPRPPPPPPPVQPVRAPSVPSSNSSLTQPRAPAHVHAPAPVKAAGGGGGGARPAFKPGGGGGGGQSNVYVYRPPARMYQNQAVPVPAPSAPIPSTLTIGRGPPSASGNSGGGGGAGSVTVGNRTWLLPDKSEYTPYGPKNSPFATHAAGQRPTSHASFKQTHANLGIFRSNMRRPSTAAAPKRKPKRRNVGDGTEAEDEMDEEGEEMMSSGAPNRLFHTRRRPASAMGPRSARSKNQSSAFRGASPRQAPPEAFQPDVAGLGSLITVRGTGNGNGGNGAAHSRAASAAASKRPSRVASKAPSLTASRAPTAPSSPTRQQQEAEFEGDPFAIGDDGDAEAEKDEADDIADDASAHARASAAAAAGGSSSPTHSLHSSHSARSIHSSTSWTSSLGHAVKLTGDPEADLRALSEKAAELMAAKSKLEAQQRANAARTAEGDVKQKESMHVADVDDDEQEHAPDEAEDDAFVSRDHVDDEEEQEAEEETKTVDEDLEDEADDDHAEAYEDVVNGDDDEGAASEMGGLRLSDGAEKSAGVGSRSEEAEPDELDSDAPRRIEESPPPPTKPARQLSASRRQPIAADAEPASSNVAAASSAASVSPVPVEPAPSSSSTAAASATPAPQRKTLRPSSRPVVGDGGRGGASGGGGGGQGWASRTPVAAPAFLYTQSKWGTQTREDMANMTDGADALGSTCTMSFDGTQGLRATIVPLRSGLQSGNETSDIDTSDADSDMEAASNRSYRRSRTSGPPVSASALVAAASSGSSSFQAKLAMLEATAHAAAAESGASASEQGESDAEGAMVDHASTHADPTAGDEPNNEDLSATRYDPASATAVFSPPTFVSPEPSQDEEDEDGDDAAKNESAHHNDDDDASGTRDDEVDEVEKMYDEDEEDEIEEEESHSQPAKDEVNDDAASVTASISSEAQTKSIGSTTTTRVPTPSDSDDDPFAVW